MIVRGGEDGSGPTSTTPSVPGTGVVPPSLSYLSPDLQERLVQANANKLLGELRQCLKLQSEGVDDKLLQLCALNCSITVKCRNLQLWTIFHHNCKEENDVSKIHGCFEILCKYASNLLQIDTKPVPWRTISVRNNTFIHKVDVVKGSRDILRDLGYIVSKPDGLAFPDDARPEVDSVVRVLADLHIVRAELELYLAASHLFPQHWESLIPVQSRIKQRVEGNIAMERGGRVSSLVQRFSEANFQPNPTSSPPPVSSAATSQSEYELQGQCGSNEPSYLVPQQTQPPVYVNQLPSGTDDGCDVCGLKAPVLSCPSCDNKPLCEDCNKTWHSHPRRKDHQPKPFNPARGSVHTYLPMQKPNASPLKFEPHLIPQMASETEDPYVSMNRPPTLHYSSPYSQPDESEMASGIYEEISEVQDRIQLPKPPNLPARPQPKPPLPNRNPGQKQETQQQAFQSHGATSENSAAQGGYTSSDAQPAAMADKSTEYAGSVLGRKSISSVIEELRILKDPFEKQMRIQTILSQFQRKLDQYEQEVKQILKNKADYEKDSEYKRLIGEKSRQQRQRLLLEEYAREVQEEMNRLPQRTQTDFAPRASAGVQEKKSMAGYGVKQIAEAWPEAGTRTDGAFNTPMDDAIGAQESWECEHCTMHNQNTDRVCQACFKTSDNPKQIKIKPVPKPRPSLGVGGAKPKIMNPIPSSSSEPELPSEKKEKAESMKHSYSSQQITEEQDEIYWEKMRAKENYERKKKGLPPLEEEETISKKMKGVDLEDTVAKFGLNELLREQSPRHEPDLKPKHKDEKLDTLRRQTMEQKRYTQMEEEARQIAGILKRAEVEEYTLEDIELGLLYNMDEPQNVFQWVENDLPIILSNLLDLAKGHLSEQLFEGVNQSDAKDSLHEANGDFDLAITILIAKRQALIDRLMKEGEFNREEVVQALSDHGGDEEEARSALLRKQFEPMLENVWKREGDAVDGHVPRNAGLETVLKRKELNFERRARCALVEAKLQGWGRAENVIKLLDQGVEATVDEIMDAVKQYGSVDKAREFLEWECCLCYMAYPNSQIRQLPTCECRLCVECITMHFTVQIKERHVKNLICPACQLPNIEVAAEETIYLPWLTNFLKPLVDPVTYALYESKLRDWDLMKDPNFRWCSHCENGFIFNLHGTHLNRFRMTCPRCNSKSCFKCQKKWENQHDNATCEDFKRWQEENDPEFQQEGLAKHLQENGIDCPRCNAKFALAKGGCMHFKCPTCGCEFCCGCNEAFKQGGACGKYADCEKAGLHCHHPRDCLYYLRDESIQDLQKLLRNNNVVFDVENQDIDKCIVMEQKETPDGLKDEACGREVKDNQAGLCELHYKEYLVGQINKNQIDPVELMDVEAMKIFYTRNKQEAPKEKKKEKPVEYQQRLLEDIKARFPLSGRGMEGAAGP